MAPLKGHQYVITITVHSSCVFSVDHPFYVLAAPTQEVQMAWVNACWQAAIPRTDLIQHLEKAGKLADVLGSYAQGVQANFPVADAAVLSSGGRARTAAAANVGTLAGVIRQQKNNASAPDVAALPVVVSDKPAPASMLARTTSGNVISAPTESVMHAARSWDGELSMPQRAASASLASSGTPFRTKAPPSGTAAAPSGGAATQGSGIGASPLSVTKQTAGGVALTATATSQQATEGSGRAVSGGREKQAQMEQAKALQQQINKLEKQAAAEAGHGGRGIAAR
ncbi:cytohesin-1 isoform X2 isoform B [Chlorella sorokiniana]|nr:cytohesin-1 isoform X2 isoform B [Chlorella sorokiniana]|eukprot:PRW60001.1 cytohesin-1 isoform X2 isoform B [Chlorella sorokiniana]